MAKPDTILDAALELFAERGYGATPVPLVADRAGVGAGTIYRYFPGKEGMVNALYQRWKAALADALVTDLDDGGPPPAVFRSIWARLCDFVIAHPAEFAFLETHHHQPYLDADSRAIAAEIDSAMETLVQRWQRSGHVRPGAPEVLVAQVYGGLVGVVRAHRQWERHLPDSLFEQTVDGAWAVLAAD